MIAEISLDIVKKMIRNVSDFPKPGIQFKDVTTVFKEPELFSFIVDSMVDNYSEKGINKVVCIEARGFILGGALAAKLGAGFVPIRKPGKLPAETYSKKYELEYGSDSIEIHKDSIAQNDIILLHDDLLATGGTARAAIDLLSVFNPQKVYLSFFCELDFLNGKEMLKDYEISSMINF